MHMYCGNIYNNNDNDIIFKMTDDVPNIVYIATPAWNLLSPLNT